MCGTADQWSKRSRGLAPGCVTETLCNMYMYLTGIKRLRATADFSLCVG